MPSFDPDTNLTGDRAFQLASVGPVVLTRTLGDTTGWLADHGYQLVHLQAGDWATQADFHRDVKAALDFPDHYGHNLDAFNDCLGDVVEYAYGASRDATGTVLVFTRYDAFAAREPRAAHVVLDIITGHARHAMLIGHRMLCLVQSNDPDLGFDPVGNTAVNWDPEDLRAARR